MLIVEYQEKWVKDFEKIKSLLLEELSEIDIRIEHIGSTSVVSMPAKDIIDIDSIFYKQNDFEAIKSELERIGYCHSGDQGISGREAFKRGKQSTHKLLDSIPHHLYVCHYGNEELKRHLLFREHLRNSKKARKEYAKIKYELANEANQNKKMYALLKETKAGNFINECIKRQEKYNGQ